MSATESRSPGRSKSDSAAMPFPQLAQRKRWSPLPSFIVVTGDAGFFRQALERRLIRELFGDEPASSRALLRVDGSRGQEDLLSRVLDELRTLSLLSSNRLVIVDDADAFLTEHRKILEPLVAGGFSGGHLVLHLQNKLNRQMKIARAIAQHGWIVECKTPFQRPPPWRTQDPPWKNPFSEWIVQWAAQKQLEVSLEDAYALQERVGADLAAVDASLDKLRLYLGDDARRVTQEAIVEVTGDLREDSVFELVETFLTGNRPRALQILDRLFTHGYRPQKGNVVLDPTAIALLFIGTVVPRLRNLRRAHALEASGEGPQRWFELRLTSRPFVDGFRREMRGTPPRRIERLFSELLKLDRSLKSGADARTALMLFVARN